jgi:hypothetical protein
MKSPLATIDNFRSSDVPIDFSPLRSNQMKAIEFAQQFSQHELRKITNELIDTIRDIVQQANDAQVVFNPHDPEANDPHAVPGEEHLGWSLAHLVVHVTASAEEGATFSSILARGIPYPREPRPRYETHWQSVTTKAETLQRLEESRRMCLAYLDTWPNQPHLDVYRDVSERLLAKYGPMNAPASYLFGLMHLEGHLDQFRETLKQAQQIASAHGD